MPVIVFRGRVLPAAFTLNIDKGPRIKWNDSETENIVDLNLTINDSIVTVQCNVEHYSKEYFIPLYMRAHDFAQIVVNVCAYSRAISSYLVIEKYTDVDGVEKLLNFNSSMLRPLATVFDNPNGFQRVMQIVVSNNRIWPIFNDIIQSITTVHVSVVNCARAVEAIRHIISNTESDTSAAWKKMRDVLNIDRGYLQLITSSSTKPRHGDPIRITGDITSEIVKRTWIIMNRFLEYKLRDDQSLSVDQFPILVDATPL